jgi:aldehyde dehydrogenase (NAD+)
MGRTRTRRPTHRGGSPHDKVVGQSYGGYKQSGLGREVSLEGMIAGFTQTKQINVRLGNGATSSRRIGT